MPNGGGEFEREKEKERGEGGREEEKEECFERMRKQRIAKENQTLRGIC